MGYRSTMDNLAPDKSLGFNVRRAHRAFDRLLNANLMRHKLSTGFWYYLRVLWIDNGLTQKELSKRNNVTENTTTSTVLSMTREGLVTRERDADDNRKRIVRLTPKALKLRTLLLPYARQVNEVARRNISTEELDICLDVLKRMSANLEAELTAFNLDDSVPEA